MSVIVGMLLLTIGAIQLMFGLRSAERYLAWGIIVALIGPFIESLIMHTASGLSEVALPDVGGYLVVAILLFIAAKAHASFTRRQKALGLDHRPSTSAKKRLDLD